ncbi:hypothetical protein SGPA1_21026 [Streptomyces misionensis JCM 4497]
MSTRAVARMVSEPPSSASRAAPKNRLGPISAPASTPPLRVRPPAPEALLCARHSRVSESSRTTTSSPASTSRLARSTTSSARAMCSLAVRSKVEAYTSPCTVRRISVTSSGRSSSSSTISRHSGWLPATAAASCLSSTVLPLFGGATRSPRWPLPTGVNRSAIRPASPASGCSSRRRRRGCSGVRSRKCRRDAFLVAARPSTRAMSFSARRSPRTPSTRSPLRSPYRRTSAAGTCGSAGEGRRAADLRWPFPCASMSSTPETSRTVGAWRSTGGCSSVVVMEGVLSRTRRGRARGRGERPRAEAVATAFGGGDDTSDSARNTRVGRWCSREARAVRKDSAEGLGEKMATRCRYEGHAHALFALYPCRRSGQESLADLVAGAHGVGAAPVVRGRRVAAG